MNLLKYIFLAPFSLKQQWVNFKQDLSTSEDSRESTLILVFSFVLLYLIGLFIKPYFSFDIYDYTYVISFSGTIRVYLELLLKLGFVTMIVKPYAKNLLKQEVGLYELVNIITVSLTLLWSFEFIIEYVLMSLSFYIGIGFPLMTFFTSVICSVLAGMIITNGIFAYFNSSKTKKGDKTIMILMLSFVVYGFRLVLGIVLPFIYSFIYMLN